MKFKWLIQDVGLIVSQIYKRYDALAYMNEDIAGIGVMPNHPYITVLETAINEDLDTHYVILGGVKVLNLLKSANNIADVVEFPSEFMIENSDEILKSLINGMYYDYQNFDQAYYGKKDLPLLNNNAEYISVADNLNTFFEVDKFVKPSRDLKAFDAGIIKAGDSVKSFIMSKRRQRFYLEEELVVADVQEMWDEFRFFVIDKEVVGGSAYRRSGKLGTDRNIPADVLQAAEEYALKYQPEEVFTMDLARLRDGTIKIIEYNCFNCSGVYDCDLVDTYSKLKDFLHRKSLK